MRKIRSNDEYIDLTTERIAELEKSLIKVKKQKRDLSIKLSKLSNAQALAKQVYELTKTKELAFKEIEENTLYIGKAIKSNEAVIGFLVAPDTINQVCENRNSKHCKIGTYKVDPESIRKVDLEKYLRELGKLYSDALKELRDFYKVDMKVSSQSFEENIDWKKQLLMKIKER